MRKACEFRQDQVLRNLQSGTARRRVGASVSKRCVIGLIETIWCFKLKMPPLGPRRPQCTLSSVDHESSRYIILFRIGTTPLTPPSLYKGDKISFDVTVTFLRRD